MSENKPPHPAGTPGASTPPDQAAGTPKSDPTAGAASRVPPSGPAAASSTSSATPISHEDAIQSPVKDVPPAGAPSAGDEEAVARSSTDDPQSASTVTPADPVEAQKRDAAEARASAAQSTAKQEASAQAGRAKSSAQASATTIEAAPASASARTIEAARSPASTIEDVVATDLPVAGHKPPAETAKSTGTPPPGFGAAPDFGASNPPPASALPPAAPKYLKHNDSAWSVFGRIIAARARQLFDRAGQRITQRTLRIGVSARIFHPEPGAKGLRGKTLQYLEESIAHWVMSRDVLVFMIPTVGHQGMLHPSNIRLRDYAKHLDGLLLQGGADVSPQSYAEAATSHEWPGDRVRDMYELELLHEFVESGKPVLGVCRGCQLINVAFGGTLYQDIATDVPTAGIHVNEQYDQHRHGIHFPDGSTLANMFPGRRDAIVNSIHHQAVKTLGRDLNIEAVSATDGIIEAIRYRRAPFVMGVQWHPEFHRAGGAELLDCTPLLDTFLRVARETRF
ncbi:gamma-glutamyl-gamma-aminobutyrate hydrolase family protein [Paraburkholderia sp.]|uniref:gamma-glutamyl-gamma-aminobutyrate hydrolase family protein n=1 Tax=Paraburkholderia sp. TaxID=1926495 RepID=UPI0023A07AF9|nr:gamma-glutamyl-gamma-aminobutyrate hydrolase family protein [Paraburkholderia sp.]MDE1183559.1 gamma-glutamyl-gamma-aminobutyrate hydrolase family protein [Paraburkholderia sp.]